MAILLTDMSKCCGFILNRVFRTTLFPTFSNYAKMPSSIYHRQGHLINSQKLLQSVNSLP